MTAVDAAYDGYRSCEFPATPIACTCAGGLPTVYNGNEGTLCDTHGQEDCSACDAGHFISATPAAGSAQTCNAYLRVRSGSGCELDSNGCATDGAGRYTNNEHCEIEVLASGTLTANGALHIEGQSNCAYDFIAIDSAKFCGPTGPASLVSVPVTSKSTFVWHTDGSVQEDGWTVCFAREYIVCTCVGGTAAVHDGAAGTLCDTDFQEDCSACNAGYTISATAAAGSAQTCRANTCTCEGGTPTVYTGFGGTLCDTDGAEDCSACNAGYTISAQWQQGVLRPAPAALSSSVMGQEGLSHLSGLPLLRHHAKH